MGASEHGGTPKSSISIGISIINHPFWGTPIFGNTHMIFGKFSGRIGEMIQFDDHILQNIRLNFWPFVFCDKTAGWSTKSLGVV